MLKLTVGIAAVITKKEIFHLRCRVVEKFLYLSASLVIYLVYD